jgi:hypothetical protein
MSAQDAANWEKNYPDDLNKNNKVKTGQDYFTIPVVDLKIGQQYSFNFQWVYPNGKVSPWSDGLTLTAASYVSQLTKPTITVTPASLGYTVSYTKQTDKNFDNAIIEEAVSTSNTAPTSGYQEVGVTSSNPITITVGDVLKRWVRLKLTDKIAGNTAYSDPVSVTPVDPVAAALDITPPTAASGITAAWSGNNILITATVSVDAKKFIIRLTNGSNDGFFTKFPSTSGTSQSILITQQELYNTFGEYYTSFTGLFVSADSLDNRDSGVSFTVSEKTNVLLGVVPTFTLTGITNGYTATWTLPSGASYAKVYESGTSWGSGNPTESDLVFSGASPAIIKKTVYTLRYVKIRYITDDGFTSSWSAEQSVTPIDAIAADTNAPSAPSTISATSGTDSTGTIGFNGVVNISWSAVSDSTLRGYRIRFRPYRASAPFESYSYVDSPGTGTSYRLAGLALGTTYEVGIASYDEFNNTSSAYTALSPNIAVSGTPFVGTNVSTTGYFEAGVSGTDTGTFKFGYGVSSGKRGVVLNANNYWYIDSSEAASFKIGGSTSNYVSWNGNKLSVDGDLGVAGGTTIGGNIAMGASGASIYQGTLNGSGNLTSDGFLLNSSGLVIKKNAIQLRLDTSDGGIYAEYGQIAGWTIDSSKFERGTTGTYTGISSSGTYAIWAGSSVSAGNSSAKFSVTPAGAVTASDITITGGSLTVGASSIAASTGKLISTDAEITGKITANSGSITGNLDISGTFYIGASASFPSERILINSGGIAAYAANDASPRFQLSKDGTGKIGGWTINSTSLSAGGITLNSASQHISFTNGFLIDNDNFTYNVAGSVQSSSSYYGSDSNTDGIVGDGGTAASTSFVSAPPGTAVASSVSIKPSSGYNATTSPALFMSTSGYSTLQAGGSYISLSSTGVVINTNTAGGIALKGFTTARHRMYDSTKEAGAVLQIFSDGRVTAGRSFYRSGASESSITNINHSTWPDVGLIGDVIFSTAD